MAEAKTKAAPTIHSKLLEFQKKNISIKKGKTNPHFKNKYADINEVLEKVKPALNELGVVIIQLPEQDGLRTFLHDTESGTHIEGYLEFSQKGDAQKLGSNITYYRRYSLVAMLGLEDEDNDGNAPTATEKKTASTPPPQVPRTMTPEEAFTHLRTATNLDELKARFQSLPLETKKDVEVIALKDELKVALDI